MRNLIILIVSIISVNFAPTLAHTRIWFQNSYNFYSVDYFEDDFVANLDIVAILDDTDISKHDSLLKRLGSGLIAASDRGSIKTVEQLISNGTDVNTRASVLSNITALMAATWRGYTEIVELLISNRAEVNVSDNDGYTALMLASYQGHTEIVELLILRWCGN